MIYQLHGLKHEILLETKLKKLILILLQHYIHFLTLLPSRPHISLAGSRLHFLRHFLNKY